MFPSRYVHMFPRQRDLMGFDEVGARFLNQARWLCSVAQ